MVEYEGTHLQAKGASMTFLPPTDQKPRYVQAMFARIAPRYDLLNRLMTGGQDVRWRREVIRRAHLGPGQRLLDIGAGTGDLAWEAYRRQPQAQIVAADFTLPMMQVGRRRKGRAALHWTAADALHLPFAAQTFDAVVSGFLLRNVADVVQALREQYRVLRPGGRIVILETTPPPRGPLGLLVRVHFRWGIPLLGRLLAGDAQAYRYLPQSSEQFLSAPQLAAHMIAVGFREVGYRKRMLGTVAIHWGEKPTAVSR